ncbi:putative 50 kda protein in type i retrotransposable element r1dm [Lasius niger]|uniref:Putative 50 kDa protein in type i retrotransposable element r1dm n=1 Tax=Lasius niger TaxID=67767 RepID=A0A0J7KA44_LASNI|nr:putative 50 kda protein in type i retrotransposable element r1dm [Lasius niger]
MLTNLLEERTAEKTETIKNVFREVLEDFEMGMRKPRKMQKDTPRNATETYAAIAARDAAKVHISSSSLFDIPVTTSFVIAPDKDNTAKFTSSQATREAVCRLLKPSDCDLKVDKITSARNNGVRIEAVSPDLRRIGAHLDLKRAGLKVTESAKVNPRLIIYGVPADMTPEEIKRELIAQNLSDCNENHLKGSTVLQMYDLRTFGTGLQIAGDLRSLFGSARDEGLQRRGTGVALLQLHKVLQGTPKRQGTHCFRYLKMSNSSG